MQASESVTVDNRRVIIRTGDATVTVYLTGRGTGKETSLVTVNRDVGGPTETIPRQDATFLALEREPKGVQDVVRGSEEE